ncbi:hypothetical protein [Flammeovirga kamogawensis]|uniref:Outer membrane beta-barrel protein n=1 Tax=Flammeovirga kamogawensis TaxID=373891 RepID=A0ABX8GZ36_9BACT|nr:hypothetical protein [Flammeovirga kamogawensis]MBB6459042.1 hypothetical protein [Flammeovirga kamogawensis]QWG08612.1 hypothetical protein KM029_06660 [Flammeovirga kamogawensis]TRX66905.1 hypothetical protein EO216_01705 [Flammeovirga kamogawensis]
MEKTKLYLIVIFFLGLITSLNAQDKPQVGLGGILRFTYNYATWKPEAMKRGGDFGYDTFALTPKAKYKGIGFKADFRFYASNFGGMMLRKGWFDYHFSDKNSIELGLTQVPFGNTPFNSSNFFFSLNCYVGLEDDYDMGVKFIHNDERYYYTLAFFKNAEELKFGNDSDISNSRYAYDVASFKETNNQKEVYMYRNKEINQFAGSIARHFTKSPVKETIGISGILGGLYNLDTYAIGTHVAGAVFYNLDYKKWNMKAQLSYYKKTVNAPKGERTDVIAMTAFGAPYLVAAEASTYTFGVSYTVSVVLGPLTSLKFYNDFSMVDKVTQEKEFKLHDSYENVTGCMIKAGAIITYVDAAFGKNHPWLGPNYNYGLAEGNGDANWNFRLNMNIGYYF